MFFVYRNLWLRLRLSVVEAASVPLAVAVQCVSATTFIPVRIVQSSSVVNDHANRHLMISVGLSRLGRREDSWFLPPRGLAIQEWSWNIGHHLWPLFRGAYLGLLGLRGVHEV